MKQLSMFNGIEVGDKVYILDRQCTVKDKTLANVGNGDEIFYKIHDPTGLGAYLTLTRKNFTVEG